MSDLDSAYGLWVLVLISSAVFIVFAYSFAKPATRRDWHSFGAFSAFIMALFKEKLRTLWLPRAGTPAVPVRPDGFPADTREETMEGMNLDVPVGAVRGGIDREGPFRTGDRRPKREF